MICPKCGADNQEDALFCKMCQEPLTDESVGRDDPARLNQEAPVPAEAPAPAPVPAAPKKKSNLPIYLAIVAVVAVLAILAAVLGGRNASNEAAEPSAEASQSADAEASANSNAVSYNEKTLSDGAVAQCEAQGYTMTNTEFNYYYWGQYYYVVAAYGDVLSYYFDATLPLSEQMFDETQTWEQYFCENAIASFIQTKGLVFKAEADGFTMPEDSRTAYDQTLEELQSYATEYEYESVDAYIAASYGEGSDFETFSKYLYDSYYSSAYTDMLYASQSFTDDEISQYYDSQAENYAASGIAKDDTKVVDVRHILVAFETAEDGTVTDEANAAAKEKAQGIFDQWKADGGTEDAFVALVAGNTDDTGTAEYGGLCQSVAPGDTVTAFNDWIFADGREAGDCEMVETEYGWHIVYFVSQGEVYWKLAAQADLSYETIYATVAKIAEGYSFDVDKQAIIIEIPTDVSAGYVTAEEAAQAEEAAAGVSEVPVAEAPVEASPAE